MRLRTLIFIVLLALGIVPILTLVGVNLRAHLNQHEAVEKKRTAAGVETSFASLNARVKCLKKSLAQAAAIPKIAGLDPGRLAAPARLRLAGLLAGQLNQETAISGLSLFNAEGKRLFQLKRGADALLALAPDSGPDPEPPFARPVPDKDNRVYLSLPQGESGAPLSGFELASPILLADGARAGMVVIEIVAARFFDGHENSWWLTPEGALIHAPIALALPGQPGRLTPAELGGLFPSLALPREKGRPFVWESEKGQSLAWLPLSFNDNRPPELWLAMPIDRSAAREWKLSLIYNIIAIVISIAVVVALIAGGIARKTDRIKEAILTGLDAILTKGKSEVRFSWGGPQELTNLADELTNLATSYTETRARQREAEADLRQSEDKFRNLTATAQDAIVMMDHQGNISYWNEAAAEIFAYRAEEAMGKPIHALISPRLSETGRHEVVTARPDKDGPIRETIELIARRKDGSEVPIELSLSEARIKGQWNSIWIIRDITERRKAEAEALLQQQQLIQADKMISLGVLVAGVAHEINNPNSIAMLNAAMLSRAWENARPILEEYSRENGDFLVAGLPYSEMRAEAPRLFAELEESGRRIKNIVSDLKDYARQDTTRRMEPVAVNEVIEAAVRLNQNKIKNATQNFRTELAPNLPPIRGNRQRLEQVLINLIQNSCEALTGPEQEIVVSSAASLGTNEVVVRVYDQGSGIPEEIIHRITDPFFTTKRSLGGTGLGLSVSAGIIEEHHGRLSFASSQEGGATATIFFPVSDGEPHENPGKTDPAH